jgi:hypothetical protein
MSSNQAQAIQDFYNSVGGQALEEAVYLGSGLSLGNTNEFVFDPDQARFTPPVDKIEITGYENGETRAWVDDFGNRHIYYDSRPEFYYPEFDFDRFDFDR